MPIMIKRKNGEVTPLINGEYLSAFYFFPKEMLEKAGREFFQIPRDPMRAILDWNAISVIESNLFRLLMIDGFALMVWPFFGVKNPHEAYSGYAPPYILSHSPGFWVDELIKQKIIPDSVTLARIPWADGVGFTTMEEVSFIMQRLVPTVIEKYNMQAAIDISAEFPCFEDFDFRDSFMKRDFFRKWYHTRTKHPIVSLEEMQTNEDGEFIPLEIHDEKQDFEEDICSQLFVDKFKSMLSERDMNILTLRMEGMTFEEIADRLGYRNHSGVQKRIKRIAEAYINFCGDNNINA